MTGKVIIISVLTLCLLLLFRAVKNDSLTYDELLHVASGVEWQKVNSSQTDPFNPPLPKLPAAVISLVSPGQLSDPFLVNLRLVTASYTLGLILLVWLWTKYRFGLLAATIASVLVAFEPTVLAHGHLFTTDMIATLVFFALFVTFDLFQDKGQKKWLLASYALMAILIGTKMTLIPMFGSFLVVYLLFTKKTKRNPLSIWGIAVLCLIVFVIFRGNIFEAGRIFVHDFSYVFNPKFEVTHSYMFFEQISRKGWFVYPFIILPIKLSLTLLAGLVFGLIKIKKGRWYLLLPVLVILGVVSLGRYNTGIRQLLPLFPFLAIIAAVGIARLRPVFIAVILLIHVAQALFVRDYIAYFNPLVGTERGGKIAVESNLDIGQSLPLAATEIDPSKIDFYLFNTTASPKLYGFTGNKLEATSVVENKKVLISRTIWYTGQYFSNPRWKNRTVRLVAGGTLVLVE